jgi:ATP-dependent Clp protease ATP-binding subunit ClpA
MLLPLDHICITSLSPAAQLSVGLAVSIAGDDAQEVEPFHLLSAISATPGAAGADLLESFGVRVNRSEHRDSHSVAMAITPLRMTRAQPLKVSTSSFLALTEARLLAEEMGHAIVGTEHLLIAVLKNLDAEVKQTIAQAGLTADIARRTLFGDDR